MDRDVDARVVCQGGLDSTANHLMLSSSNPGTATRLVNYEVGSGGGYRRLSGYVNFGDEVGVGVSEGPVLGIAIFPNASTGVTEYIAARKLTSGDEYKFYLKDGDDWDEITTGLTHTYSGTIEKVRYAIGNDGVNNFICLVDGVNNAVLYDGTTWAFIDSSSTGADMAHAGGSQALDAPQLVAFFAGQLILAADSTNTQSGILAASAPNAFFDFTAANGGQQVIAGLEIVDIGVFRDTIYVFGGGGVGIKKVTQETTDTTVILSVQDVTSNIGCVARDSVVEIGGDLYFLAPDGIRPIAGTDKIGDVQLETVSKPIQKLLQLRILALNGAPIVSVAIRGKSQFRYFLTGDDEDMAASRGLIAGLRTSDPTTGWEFGEILGFRASCATSHYVDGVEIVLHGDYDGFVYHDETGNSLNGTEMIAVYSTPYLDFGSASNRKVMQFVRTFFVLEGDFNCTLGVEYDWGDPKTATPISYNVASFSGVTQWDDGGKWDDGAKWDGDAFPITKTEISGSCLSMRLTYSSSSVTAPHTIQAIIIDYIQEGRK